MAARGPPGAAAAVADAGVAVVEAAADVCVRGGGREPGRSVLVRAARAVVACAEVFGEEQLMRVAAAVAGAAAAAEGRGEQPWADAGAVLVDMADAVAGETLVAACNGDSSYVWRPGGVMVMVMVMLSRGAGMVHMRAHAIVCLVTQRRIRWRRRWRACCPPSHSWRTRCCHGAASKPWELPWNKSCGALLGAALGPW